MIAIDTSAIMAIIFREPEAAAFLDCVLENQTILIGLPTILELRLVGEGRTVRSAASDAMAFVNDPRFRRVAFDDAHLAVAIDAFDRYGKGRHPARLNFGDCMAYAVAAVAGIPLLYKGDDFARTDIRPAR